jgi:phenylacetate-CoA ligase
LCPRRASPSDPIETAPRKRLEALQVERLRSTVARRGLDAGVDSLADLRDLPFTTKDDLRAHYPLGMMTVPRAQLVRLHSSSGTSGRPTIVGHTRRDLGVWADLMARSLACAGVQPGMVVHNGYPYGLTTGGFGFQQGAGAAPHDRRAGGRCPDRGPDRAAPRPADAGPVLHAQIAETLGPDGVADLALEVGIFGGEMWRPALRARLQAALGIRARNAYGLSEVIGPGVAAECWEGHGWSHVHEDHFLGEVIDPVTTDPVVPGAAGEIVITTLTREAMPLIRYRTGAERRRGCSTVAPSDPNSLADLQISSNRPKDQVSGR